MSNPKRRDIILQLTAEEADVLVDLLGNLPAFSFDLSNAVLGGIFDALSNETGSEPAEKYFTSTSYTLASSQAQDATTSLEIGND